MTEYGVVVHDEDATIVYSGDGFTWHEVCTCAPEWAVEIAEALEFIDKHKEEARNGG